MASLTRFSLGALAAPAAPTTPPAGLSTLSSGGLTGLRSSRPGLLTAFGKVLQHILSLTTTASTFDFKWLSLGNFSGGRLNLPPTPTSGCYLQPTTFITNGNFSLAITAIPLMVIFLSILFGAGVVHFRRRGGSSTSRLRDHRRMARNEKPSPKSLHFESPTLFYQGGTDAVLPLASYIPRLSDLWISSLSFILRGLAFLFRLICIEELLDVVDENTTEEKAAAGTNHIPELPPLDKKLGPAMNIATPTQAVVSPADVNKTLVAPFSPVHTKSKLGQVFLPPSDNKVDILLSEDMKACPPTSIEIDTPSTHNAPVTSAIAHMVVKTIDPLAVVDAGPTCVPSFQGGEGMTPSLPTSNRRSWLRNRPSTPFSDSVIAPSSVEPAGVPDMPLATSSPVYKSSYHSFRPIHPSTNDCPLTPPRISLSVEPSGVPDRALAALEPQTESSAQAEVRRIFQRCLDDAPRRSRYSKTSVPDLDVASKPRSASVYQADLQRIFQPCFDDPLQPNSSKSTTLTSAVRPLDPPFEIESSHRKSTSVKREDLPKMPPREDILATHRSPKDFQLPLTRDILAATGAEETPPQNPINTSQNGAAIQDSPKDIRFHLTGDQSTIDAETKQPRLRTRERDPAVVQMELRIKFLRERLARKLSGAPPRLPTSTSRKDTAATQHSPKDVQFQSTRNRLASTGSSTDAEADRPPLASTQPRQASIDQGSLPKVVPKGTKACETSAGLIESGAALRERGRRSMERARETAAAYETSSPSREHLVSAPRTLTTPEESQEVPTENTPDRECPVSTSPSKYLTLTNPEGSEEVPTGKRLFPTIPNIYRSLTKLEDSDSEQVPPTTPSLKRPLSTLPSQSLNLTRDFDFVAQLHSLLELDTPTPGNRLETDTENEQSWSPSGCFRPPPLEPRETRKTESQVDKSASSIELSWRIEDYVPEATDDETWSEVEAIDVENQASTWDDHWHPSGAESPPTTPIRHPRLQSFRTFSESSYSRSHAFIGQESQPQKIHDLFYSPPSTPKRQRDFDPTLNTDFLRGENSKLTGFGFGSPSSRRMQRLDPRDTFYTSTPRVNHAHFGGFCTSTPRRDVDQRRDTWQDFF